MLRTQLPNRSKPIYKVDYLLFSLNYNITAVFVHEPKFFVFKDNNLFVPFLKKDNTFQSFMLAATTKKRMNRASKFECNTDENYNFGDCVRQKIVESQGCRTENDMPRCSNVSSMQAYEVTGCNPPCTFTQYSLHNSFPVIFYYKDD